MQIDPNSKTTRTITRPVIMRLTDHLLVPLLTGKLPSPDGKWGTGSGRWGMQAAPGQGPHTISYPTHRGRPVVGPVSGTSEWGQ